MPVQKKSAASAAKTSKTVKKTGKKSASAKNLVIVESPTKARTIKKFLGSNYDVVASAGHVRDLPKSKMGVDIEHDFEPEYITIRGKGQILAMLKKKVKTAKKVYLATDPDREGEAISWHLYYALNLKDKDCSRITFNEITKNAVREAMKHGRDIDQNLVDAQQARRVFDRLVGYEISPILWVKVKRGLSAGRVQSAVLGLIADREKEINEFIPKEYWSLDAQIKDGAKKPLVAHFSSKDGKKLEISSKEQMDGILDEIKGKPLSVDSVKESGRVKKGPQPFTTSTLQQDAAGKLNFSTQKTMQIAQQLYEGVTVKGHGSIGLITYLRTDSTRVSAEAVAAARVRITEDYGEEYLAKTARKDTSGKRIQDAHEAIRPSYIDLKPAQIKDDLTRDQFRLYQLIYSRFMASQMENARYDVITASLSSQGYRFSATASKLAFEGFLAAYDTGEEKTSSSALLAKLRKGMTLENVEYDPEQHFTQAPPRYTEQSMVKTMEDLGIGRPSTYSSTINTLLKRYYVVKDGKALCITELGEAVDNIMKKAFPAVVDVTFTANFETLLDGVEEGKIPWKEVIRNNYPDLHEAVVRAEKDLDKVEIQDEVTDEICEKCGRHMVIKFGKYGKFLACPGFPECSNTRPYYEKIGVACPKCGKDIVIKKTRKGRRYYGCSGYPDCDFMSWQRPAREKCPRCGSYMIIRGRKMQCSDKECGYVCPVPDDEYEKKPTTAGKTS